MNKIKVLFEDNHIIAVEKPSNVPTQLDSSNDEDMLSIVKFYIKEKYNKPGNVYLGLIHRLDRPVGGVIIFAKTSKAASRLSTQIKTGKVAKTYLAVVDGNVMEEGTFKDYLYKDSETNIVKVVEEGFKDSKYAELHYDLIETKDNMSFVKIYLKTGRSHQIRVQFSSHGYPIIGDMKYNDKKYENVKNIALWSYEMKFTHPTTGVVISVKSNPPEIYPWRLFISN